MSNQKQIASSVPATSTSIDEVLKLIKQHAHGIKKASISIFDREGMKLSLAQEAAAGR